MSFALLWIETVSVCLLFVAMMDACAARFKKRWARILLMIVAVGYPTINLLAFATGAAIAKYAFVLEVNWYWYEVSQFIAFCAGAFAIVWLGQRRPEAGMSRAAATWPRGQLAIAWIGAAAIGWMTFWNMDLAVRAQAGILKVQAGAIMLQVAPPMAQDDQNAAIPYEKAIALITADSALNSGSSALDQDPIDIHSSAVADLLNRHARDLALFHQGALLPQCRFDRNYGEPSISMLLPELNPSRLAVRLIQLHARVELANGRVDSALSDIGDIFRLSRNIGQEPILVSSLVSMAIEKTAIDTLADALPHVTRQQQLDNVLVGDVLWPRRMLQRGLRGESAFGMSVFADFSSGKFDLNTMSEITGNPAFVDIAGLNLQSSLYRVFLLADDLDHYSRYLDQYQKDAASAYFSIQNHLLTQQQESEAARAKGILTSMLAPSLKNAFLTTALAEARRSGAFVAVAMTRYRLDHGAFPTHLSDLTPAYLDEIPIDPFDGQPLRLAFKDGHAIVYSVGPDLKDDGGGELKSLGTVRGTPVYGGDVCFVLKTAGK